MDRGKKGLRNKKKEWKVFLTTQLTAFDKMVY